METIDSTLIFFECKASTDGHEDQPSIFLTMVNMNYGFLKISRCYNMDRFLLLIQYTVFFQLSGIFKGIRP